MMIYIMIFALVVFFNFSYGTEMNTSIELKDGRVLTNARLFKADESEAILIWEGGILNINTSLLPDHMIPTDNEKTAGKTKTQNITRPNAHRNNYRIFNILNTENVGNVTNSTDALNAVVLIEVYDRNKKYIAHGTGFFVGPNGHVFTNSHVVEGASYIKIIDRFGQNFIIDRCELVLPARDLAIFKIKEKPEKFFKINSSANEKTVISVLGHPKDLRWHFSPGLIQEKHLILHQEHFTTCAEIKPGNSGGPVVNEKFEVVGQAQYIIYKRSSVEQNALHISESIVYRAKMFDFINDPRWSLRDISIQRMSEYIANYNAFEVQIEFFSVFYNYYSEIVYFLENLSYTNQITTNNRHLGIDGRPIVTSNRMYVNMPNLSVLTELNQSFSKILEQIIEYYPSISLSPIYREMIATMNNVNMGIRMMNRAHGNNFDSGIPHYNNGLSSFRSANNNLRNIFSIIKDQLDYIGPPGFVLEHEMDKYLELSRLSDQIIGFQLFGAYFD